MPWIKVQNPPAHRCAPPALFINGLRDRVTVGDEWQCEGCNTIWVVRPHPNPRTKLTYRVKGSEEAAELSDEAVREAIGTIDQ